MQLLENKIAEAVSIQEKIDLMNKLAWQLRIKDPEKALSTSQESLQLSQSSGMDGKSYERGIAASLVVLSFWMAKREISIRPYPMRWRHYPF